MLLTGNFGFLTGHDPQLVQLGALAERYFRDDSATAIFKLRQFAELLSKAVAARHALYLGERKTFEDMLRRGHGRPALCERGAVLQAMLALVTAQLRRAARARERSGTIRKLPRLGAG
jgi:hypothetical protein